MAMINKELLKLVAGFRRFRDRYFSGEDSLYSRLSSGGQSPKTLIIGCSDSRVDPALLSSASPGDIFVVRNVANLVPPYESANSGYHGVSAAIEFAVVNLKVENVVVLGHRQCGGIRALMSGTQKLEGSFVGRWVEIAKPARTRVLERYAKNPEAIDFEAQCKECEMEGIVTSLENLKTFPFISEAIEQRGMNVVGIYFDLEQGQLFEYFETEQTFKQIEFPQKQVD
jgi:carbonic anhydrase